MGLCAANSHVVPQAVVRTHTLFLPVIPPPAPVQVPGNSVGVAADRETNGKHPQQAKGDGAEGVPRGSRRSRPVGQGQDYDAGEWEMVMGMRWPAVPACLPAAGV